MRPRPRLDHDIRAYLWFSGDSPYLLVGVPLLFSLGGPQRCQRPFASMKPCVCCMPLPTRKASKYSSTTILACTGLKFLLAKMLQTMCPVKSSQRSFLRYFSTLTDSTLWVQRITAAIMRYWQTFCPADAFPVESMYARRCRAARARAAPPIWRLARAATLPRAKAGAT